MEFDWSIVGWVAGLIFVYLFGLFEGRGQGYKRRKAEEEQEKKEQPPAPVQTESVTVDDPGILRIKQEGGAFTLDLDGTRVNPISLTSPQRRRLIEVLNIIRPWLENKPAAPAIPKPSAPPPPAATVEDRLSAIGSTLPPPPATPPAKPAAVPPATPRPAPGTAQDDRPVAPANSIVGQIDSILQSRLAGTPLEDRGIFLAQSPEGGVIVYVGLTRYNGIDDVPDPEIKSAIRAAIAEWENKFTPGL